MNTTMGIYVMRAILLIGGLCLALPAAAQVYRTVDEHGNVIFSDTPSEGAEEVQIQEVQTIPAEKARDFEYEPREKEEPAYSRLEITQPGQDATIRDNQGNVSISVSVSPRLRSGHTLALFMDGNEAGAGQGGSFNLTNVDRGTHTLRAVVKDRDGSILESSPSVTFHLFRESIKHPPPRAPGAKPKPGGS